MKTINATSVYGMLYHTIHNNAFHKIYGIFYDAWRLKGPSRDICRLVREPAWQEIDSEIKLIVATAITTM